MKSSEDRLSVLKRILLQAYLEKEQPQLAEGWHRNVMQRVSKVGPLQSKSDLLMHFGQFVWRLTPVTCLLIILSAVILLKFDFTPDYKVLMSLITDSEEVSLVQLLPL